MELILVLLILSAGVGAVCVIICGMAYGILRALNITRQRTRWASWAGATLSLVAALFFVGCDVADSTSGGGYDTGAGDGGYETGAAGGDYGGSAAGGGFCCAEDGGTAEAGMVTASRAFAGPTQYPPEDFAAYGILAFQSRASSYNRSRHLMICKAYVSNLPHTSELKTPTTEQMATVWPMDSDSDARFLNTAPRQSDSCELAVDNYGLVVAKQALKEAELAGVDTTNSGPFLLAWSPSTDKGKPDALVLVSDLSGITTYAQADGIFRNWSGDIESDPNLWTNGWNIERLRVTIRNWVDAHGTKALELFGSKG